MKILVFFLLIPAIIASGLFFTQFKEPELLNIPNQNYIYDVYAGTSQGNFEYKDPNILKFNYSLSEQDEHSSISLAIWDRFYGTMDFSAYDQLNITIDSNKSEFILIQLNLLLDGYSKPGDFNSYFPVGYYLELNETNNKYTIPLNKLEPYSWWLALNQKSYDSVKNFNFSSVATVYIATDPSFPVGVEDTITIQHLSLETGIQNILQNILLVLGIYYLLLATLFLFLKRNKVIQKNREKIILIPYKSAELPAESSEESQIENYICSNYTNPLLNVAMIEDNTGIPERTVSKILKRKYNYSFPGFINYLRLTEAKNLLKKTDMKIIDVAMAVGYNSQGHFNRIFKKEENITPREFKKQTVK